MNLFWDWWDRLSRFLWPGVQQRLIADALTALVVWMLWFALVMLLIMVLA